VTAEQSGECVGDAGWIGRDGLLGSEPQG